METIKANKNIFAVFVGVILLFVLVIVVFLNNDNQNSSPTVDGLKGVEEANTIYDNIPQSGLTLGNPKAPVRIVAFVDLQCNKCAKPFKKIIPDITNKYVKKGQVKLELKPLVAIGEDSKQAGLFTVAAGQQKLSWPFTQLFFYNQAKENTGYINLFFIKNIAKHIEGLNVKQAEKFSQSKKAENILNQSQKIAIDWKVSGIPSLYVQTINQVREQEPELLNLQAFNSGVVYQQIDRAIENSYNR